MAGNAHAMTAAGARVSEVETRGSTAIEALGIPAMSEREFELFSEVIHAECGIFLPLIKRTMLTTRLVKRLRALGLPSFQSYLDYVLSDEGREQELAHMLDVVSTNKTEFFREADHFDFLARRAVPEFARQAAQGGPARLKVWSAGCSTGEEPYTIAMVAAEALHSNPGLDFEVLATDISTRVLAHAKNAVYANAALGAIPAALRHKYLMRGMGRTEGYHRVIPELRAKVAFRRLNLIELGTVELEPQNMIFCRNVIIYFNRETQVKLFQDFYEKLTPGGLLFIGHSETLTGICSKFEQVASTIYRRPQ